MENEWHTLLQNALVELARAAKEMVRNTVPATPIPRPRFFEIAPEIVWPLVTNYGGYWSEVSPVKIQDDYVYFTGLRVKNGTCLFESNQKGTKYAAAEILNACQHSPRLVLRALRRIQAATEWCRRRAEGRRRAAQEILRQQSRAHSVLEAETALQALTQ